MVRFEWDEVKRLRNIERHNLDFRDADILFGGKLIVGEARTTNGESRLMATGTLDDVHVTAIYTLRGGIIRMIYLRRARDAERKRHEDLHGS